MRIRSSMLALTLSLAALAAPAFAAGTAAKPMTAQQQKMADCSHQSKGMKGDAHKQFMSNCLKGDATPASMAKMSQQDKMKTCNAAVKTKAPLPRLRLPPHRWLSAAKCRSRTR